MHTRYRAAATALLLTATTGLAATGAAQASGTHHPNGRAAHKLVVTIKSKASGVKLSESQIRPGNTIFRVKNAGGPNGLMQLLRLKPGYTLTDAFSDFAAAFPDNAPPDVAAVNRVDKNVVFYGGMETPHKAGKVNTWAVDVDVKGTYYVVNLDANALTPLSVKGHHQRRAMPSADGTINAAPGPGGAGNAFKPGKHNAAKGWMSTTNRAHEPHFLVVQHVKKHTTKKDVLNALQGSGPPKIFLKGGTDTGVISPHHTFVWAYGFPKGKYFVTCFWPSKSDGMPHAFMGMISLFNLG
jgi:hypothetical protein